MLEGLSSYSLGRWSEFVKDICKFFEAEKDAKRYKVRDLEEYTNKMRRKDTVPSLDKWNKYNRGFIRIAGWLKKEGRMSDHDYNFYYWKGIPRAFRSLLESRIVSQYPGHDLSTPFTSVMILRAAESLLKRDRFDKERFPSDDEDSDISDQSDDDLDTDSSSDSSEEEKWSRKGKKKSDRKKEASKKKKKQRKVNFKEPSKDSSDSESDSDAPPRKAKKASSKTEVKTSSKEEDEVQELIKKMGNMSLDNAMYAAIYLRACSLNSMVQHIVGSPNDRRWRLSSQSQYNRDREQPPHYDRRPRTSGGSGKCYGCGEFGHSMNSCPQIQQLVTQGILTKDQTGKYVLKSGERITRQGLNEPLVKAVQRVTGNTSHYISFNSEPDWYDFEAYHSYYGNDASEYDWENNYISFDEDYPVVPQEDNYVAHYDAHATQYGYWSDDEDTLAPFMYPVTRNTKSTTTNRKDRTENTRTPAKREEAKRKNRELENPFPSPAAKKAAAKPTPVRNPQPVDVPRSTFDPSDDDVIMKDPAKEKTKKTSEKENHAPEKKRDTGSAKKEEKRPAQQSDVQASVDLKSMLDKVLKAPVSWSRNSGPTPE